MTPPIESSFERLLVRLVRDEIDFVVVGGIAVCLNGYVRLTEDVDILIDPDRSNVERLISSLAKFGEGFAAELGPEDFDEEEGAVRVVEDSEDCQIDIFTVMHGLCLVDFRNDIRHFETSGIAVPYLGPLGLIRLKQNTHREKDSVDISALRQLMENPDAFE
ncbi:MAG: nucleotidyl transferase AbiEii/AbiGii toxin family protein [Verrucomicrobiae bacterium]|nr:nucleotidyl transferase AbiEii/AbiGii toxin family protein [Verrucomicrobiae bacterium]